MQVVSDSNGNQKFLQNLGIERNINELKEADVRLSFFLSFSLFISLSSSFFLLLIDY